MTVLCSAVYEHRRFFFFFFGTFSGDFLQTRVGFCFVIQTCVMLPTPLFNSGVAEPNP